MYIFVSVIWISIVSGNGLVPVWHQAISWKSAELSVSSINTKLNRIWMKITKVLNISEMWFTKCLSFYWCLSVLRYAVINLVFYLSCTSCPSFWSKWILGCKLIFVLLIEHLLPVKNTMLHAFFSKIAGAWFIWIRKNGINVQEWVPWMNNADKMSPVKFNFGIKPETFHGSKTYAFYLSATLCCIYSFFAFIKYKCSTMPQLAWTSFTKTLMHNYCCSIYWFVYGDGKSISSLDYIPAYV